MYSLFLIDGFYCVAKEINKAWVVRFKTKSKLEAELFKGRLNKSYIKKTEQGVRDALSNYTFLGVTGRELQVLHGNEAKTLALKQESAVSAATHYNNGLSGRLGSAY